MNYMTTTQAAAKWQEERQRTDPDYTISPIRVRALCEQGRVPGAFILGNRWLIPVDAKNPAGKVGQPRKQKPGE